VPARKPDHENDRRASPNPILTAIPANIALDLGAYTSEPLCGVLIQCDMAPGSSGRTHFVLVGFIHSDRFAAGRTRANNGHVLLGTSGLSPPCSSTWPARASRM
jgi:hypothetical protein